MQPVSAIPASAANDDPDATERELVTRFIVDQMTDGRCFLILTIVDDCARECLALVAATSLYGVRVARELDRLLARRGRPKMIVGDNGREFTSNAVLGRSSRVAHHRPWQADAERLIGRYVAGGFAHHHRLHDGLIGAH